MPEANAPDPIAGPTPVKNPAGSNLLTRVIAAAAATVGGVLIFAPMLVPTCAKGATRSARLKWEQRQREIQTAITEAALRGDLPESVSAEKASTGARVDDGTAGPN
jgi:hypothetical protein